MQLLVAYHAVYRALNKSDDPYPVLPGEVGDYRGCRFGSWTHVEGRRVVRAGQARPDRSRATRTVVPRRHLFRLIIISALTLVC